MDATVDEVNSYDGLQDAVETVIRGRIVESTRRDYVSRAQKMANWLAANGHASATRITMRGRELVLDRLQVDMVNKYLLVVLQSGKSYSSLSSIRSALNFTFVEEQKQMPEEMQKKLTHMLRGCKRAIQQEKRHGNRRMKEGKEPLSYALYLWIQKKFFTESTPKSALYSVLTWNLMCRSNNTAHIQINRMSWENDALAIYFAVTKSDQAGERPVAPKHVYANPYEPYACPILNLGIYLLCNPLVQNSLFPGSNPQHTFEQAFLSIRSSPTGARDFGVFGANPDDVGVHSYRKGSTTYVSGSSTAGPGYSSLCTRAGWKMGNVQDRYIHFGQAGDEYVGRTVAGLPIQKPEFAILPPHFDVAKLNEFLVEQDQDLSDIVEACFPSLFAVHRVRPILQHSLASVVYHQDYLREHLPGDHQLFTTVLFTTDGVIETLREYVILGTESRYMTGTGIPPHVSQMEAYQKTRREEGSLVTRIGLKVASVVKSCLDEKFPGVQTAGTSIPAGALQGVENSITQLATAVTSMQERQEEVLSNAVAPVHSTAVTAPTEQEESNGVDALIRHDHGNGEWFLVPVNWEFPKCNIVNGWRMWWLGDSVRRISPFRNLAGGYPSELSKRFSDWKALFGKMEDYLRATGQLRGGNSPNTYHVAQMYQTVAEELIVKICPPKTKKRKNELMVSTVARKLRKVNIDAFIVEQSNIDAAAEQSDAAA